MVNELKTIWRNRYVRSTMTAIGLIAFAFAYMIIAMQPRTELPVDVGTHEVCFSGVVYYHFKSTVGTAGYGYLAPKFLPNSTVATCTEGEYDDPSEIL